MSRKEHPKTSAEVKDCFEKNESLLEKIDLFSNLFSKEHGAVAKELFFNIEQMNSGELTISHLKNTSGE